MSNDIKFHRSVFGQIISIFQAFLTVLFASISDIFNETSRSKKPLSKRAALNELRNIRENGFRDSEKVLELWNHSLSPYSYKLGHEKWIILEQVFIAALDFGDDALACDCLEELREKFRNSCRVNRLFGMFLESKGLFDEAQAIYNKLITEDPTNMLARKRLISILKAQQKVPEAVNELRQYLKIFMSDFEAWNELADLYLSEGDYKHAAFCMEEMLLSNPSNHLYYQRYAEIKYTEGGTENLELARAYFSHSCLLCPSNLRSLYGLLLTCSALDSQLGKSLGNAYLTNTKQKHINGPPGQKDPGFIFNHRNANDTGDSTTFPSVTMSNAEKNKNLAIWAMGRIRRIYAETNPESIGSSSSTTSRPSFAVPGAKFIESKQTKSQSTRANDDSDEHVQNIGAVSNFSDLDNSETAQN